ncbi:MBOAT family O-acyltransferase [Hymenobacter caeli]|uniref:D-alanyl-lipoteichoic acid acyltransferase DltB (MBOAT superfamily) n=1 Tax=Hymenobacter caeli TaxID=2735894 RepID=A0ABX2FSJ1_9BACT|nr:MBOAT family O-acyltransferase [Hymenobacter caeli]NRT19818.1 D-alanyl-lipoteichoic acid acyltransferase DltB (MBOAT superfamily) [Hymenobacter caeli]
MLFNSLHFLVFFPVVAGLYFALAPRWRGPLLLGASYYFYMSWRPAYALLLGATTLLDYFSGYRMGRLATKRQRRPYLYLSLASNLGTLFVFKYFNFFRDAAGQLAGALHLPWAAGPALGLLLPVGVSFYTFQSVGYILDVYQGRLAAERNLGRFALFVAFFPQLVAGPIERGGHMLPQFRRTHGFDYARVVSGLRLMAWGLFKKVVVADRLALLVNPVFNAPRQHAAGPLLVLATLAFTFQIYADFSGYTDMARGAARVLGFEFNLNFRQPYLAASVPEFWRRWHISLSSWFRDYLYIPLGGSRAGPARAYGNLLVVFLVSGLWHGANWTFLVWGGLHGLYLVASTWARPARAWLARATGLAAHPRLRRGLGVAVTFALVAYAWIFFRANNLGDAVFISRHLGSGWAGLRGAGVAALLLEFSQHYRPELAVAALAVALLLAVEYLGRHRSPQAWVAAQPLAARWAGYAGLALLILYLGVFNSTSFIYFQF